MDRRPPIIPTPVIRPTTPNIQPIVATPNIRPIIATPVIRPIIATPNILPIIATPNIRPISPVIRQQAIPFYELPLDVLVTMATKMTAKELVNLCATNVNIAKICQSNEFYRALISRKYNVIIANVPGNNLQEKYQFLEAFNWDIVPGESMNDKLNFVLETIHRSETEDISQPDEDENSPNFEEIVMNAVLTGNSGIVALVLNNLIKRMDQLGEIDYHNGVLQVLEEAVKIGNYDIVAVILKYFMAFKDQYFHTFEYVIGSDMADHPEFIQYLSKYIDFISEDFWTSISYGYPQIAEFIRNKLLLTGVEPLTEFVTFADHKRIDIVDKIWYTFGQLLADGHLESIKYLAQFVKPQIQRVLARLIGRSLRLYSNHPEYVTLFRELAR